MALTHVTARPRCATSPDRDGARTSCPPAGEARSDSRRDHFEKVVRAARPGGQDVRAPSLLLVSNAHGLLGIRRAEDFRMKNPRENLDAINYARTGTAEIRGRVR